MFRILANWLISALGLLIVSYVIPGFAVAGFGTALLAAAVIGLINATLGLFLKVVTFPLTLLSLGVFWFVINGLMLELASYFVRGFRVQGFIPAFFGAIVLSLVNLLLKTLAREVRG